MSMLTIMDDLLLVHNSGFAHASSCSTSPVLEWQPSYRKPMSLNILAMQT